MQITVNGEPQKVDDLTSVSDLLQTLKLTGKRLAIEINEEIIPKSRHSQHQLQAGDQVEIVHAIGGG
ncbi:sulfur carrier protein ThiS [Marinospirillum perlucidum]|uniref:sulfur carrier protein ThiS n=1 Tax=Marinospirillum perlucidum TaxID=1982602 RepID=UPI000DF1AFD5|nr:sulfur carrier protein ThiS [Marinospirillum perlucidum]